MSSATMTITAEELERMALGEQRVELVRGEVITMAPAGAEHGETAMNLGALIHAFAREWGAGVTYYSVKHESLDTNVSVSCGHWRW